MTEVKKIAIPTRNGRVDDHFGHCEYFTVLALDEAGSVVSSEQVDSPEGCGCKSGIASELKARGVEVLLAGNMGQGAVGKLTENGIGVVRGCQGDILEVVSQYVRGELVDKAVACEHHGCHKHEGDGGSVLKVG